MKRGRGSVRAVDCRLWSVDCGLPAHGFGSAMPKSAGWLCWPRSAAMAANEMVCVIPHSQWTMNCRLAARSRWTTDSGLLTRTNMKQATSAWGAIKEMEALKFLCCCPKQHVRNKALIHQPSGSTAEDPHCQVEAQETWKKALQRSKASLKRATLWTLDFGLQTASLHQ